ncbi:MAG: hypothetical protein AAGE52_30410 [Myxococcota bacterium]
MGDAKPADDGYRPAMTNPKNPRPLEPGDVVLLKTGDGPRMVVASVNDADGAQWAKVYYFVDKVFVDTRLPAVTVELESN